MILDFRDCKTKEEVEEVFAKSQIKGITKVINELQKGD